jgi:DNA-directed RNA polymerase specialized sigma24 family protein
VVEGSQLERLYRRHIDHAFRLAYLLTGNRSVAEDLAQDAFMRVAGRLVRIKDPGDFSACLRKTVVSVDPGA